LGVGAPGSGVILAIADHHRFSRHYTDIRQAVVIQVAQYQPPRAADTRQFVGTVERPDVYVTAAQGPGVRGEHNRTATVIIPLGRHRS
jgi:hypothetical protein